MIKIIVSGCCGKMGRRIIFLALKDKGLRLVGAIEAKRHPAVGKKLSKSLFNPILNIEVKDNAQGLEDADVLIEFTSASATMEHLKVALQYKKALVIGTTGMSQDEINQIKKASSSIPIVFSPNMSIGVNLIFKLIKEAALKLGNDYKADIVEAHHVHKKDAPSGTAKRIAEVIKQSPHRAKEHIKIESIREDEIVGDHQVRINGPQDLIIIKHSAKTRDIFAQGALFAAKFIAGKAPGLYDMQNVIEGR